MLNLINFDKPLTINGILYNNSKEAYEKLKDFKGELKIELNIKSKSTEVAADKNTKKQFNSTEVQDANTYKVKVRQYMTKPATPDFDFHTKYNKGIQMPMRVMVGKVIGETKGMYQMELQGKPMPTSVCMVCGRTLKNKVSTLYGIGPECGGHGNINPFDSEEELNLHWEELKEKLANIKGTWWIPKSAIEEMEVI